MEDLDVNKVAAEFVNINIEKFIKAGTGLIKGTVEKIEMKLKTCYTEYLETVLTRYSKTKSFFLRNESVYLYSFYIPLSLSKGKVNIGKAIISTLNKCNSNIIITGTAGSGKSILMKHLFLDCLNQKEKVPVFIELRDLNKENITLVEKIKKTLKLNRLDLEEVYIEKALEEGHFCLFFDGYDEVASQKRNQLAREILTFKDDYMNNLIVMSSRPDSEFSGWNHFSILCMNSLLLEEACELINKLPFDPEMKEKFVEDLKKGLFNKHLSFLSNPLLLSIMLLTYGQTADIPNKLNIFYNQAYECLFQRHDAIKGAYQRERKCKLDLQDYAKVLSGLCLQTYDKRELNFSKMQALEYLKIASKITNVEFTPEEFLEDSLQATCLLIEDGLFLTFAHRSFQEYFVARFIFESSLQFQKRLISKYKYNLRNDAVFHLLYEMNPELIETHLILPLINEFLLKIGYKRKMGMEQYLKYLQLCWTSIGIRKKDSSLLATYSGNFKSGFHYYDLISFTRKHCGELIGWKGYSEENKTFLIEKYCSDSEENIFKIKGLTVSSELVKDLAKYSGWLSKETIDVLIEIKKAIISRQKHSKESLEKILFKTN